MVVYLGSFIFNPLEVALNFDNVQEINPNTFLCVTMDIFCLFDVVLTFFTGYGISNSKEVVLDPRKIAKYLKKGNLDIEDAYSNVLGDMRAVFSSILIFCLRCPQNFFLYTCLPEILINHGGWCSIACLY